MVYLYGSLSLFPRLQLTICNNCNDDNNNKNDGFGTKQVASHVSFHSMMDRLIKVYSHSASISCCTLLFNDIFCSLCCILCSMIKYSERSFQRNRKKWPIRLDFFTVNNNAPMLRTNKSWTGGKYIWFNNSILKKLLINPLHTKFFRGNINIYLSTFCIISPHWYDTGSWNPSSIKTRTNLFYIDNIMAH